ncbi:phytanoyl-CoA dioxygenase family protein [Thalassomonas viridans]|uniref:Phytanoyl-CoA dioxygenase family protein n=1 Tax=Thalassomonas viridans TaxID=137584 RepID=A0AAF0CDI4_9GAMM|nr:phytanoyl-CoA dioxygenase family protein [Thalassomonas viridans]WDE09223.1 phytanoyl-CoA dioxygenase family protein [Thalassomonas viridans]
MYDVIHSTREIGYGVFKACFSDSEVNTIKSRIDCYINNQDYGVVYEEDGSTIRGIHGLHLKDDFFSGLIKDPRLLNLAEEHLGSKCYLHQLKINFKRPFKGAPWPWHQDFPYWKEGDGILKPDLINIAIFIDDASMLHGSLCMIPKSHLLGNISKKVIDETSWKADVSSNLTYQIEKQHIERLTANDNFEFITGKAGDVLVFDPLVIHASGNNISTYDRRLLILTYNSVDNLPVNPKHQRPDFLSANDYTPLSAI